MKRFLKLLMALAGVGSLCALALVVHHDAQPKHLQSVAPGVLIRTGLLRPNNLEKVLDEYRIKETVVSLVRPLPENAGRLEEEQRVCRKRGVRFVDLSMAPARPPTPKQLATWLDLFQDEANLPGTLRAEARSREDRFVEPEAVDQLRSSPVFAMAVSDLSRFYRRP